MIDTESGGWGCPHELKGSCKLTQHPCQPGRRGCVLYGRMRRTTSTEISVKGKGKMPKLFDRLNDKKERDIKVLASFVSVFCRENHRDGTKSLLPIRDARLQHSFNGEDLILCQDCQKLLNHGIAKLLQCPYDPKPMCKKCETHCYAPGYRERIREVMKFSGLYLVKHGRVDLMIHYFF